MKNVFRIATALPAKRIKTRNFQNLQIKSSFIISEADTGAVL